MATVSQNILSRLLVIDLQAGTFRIMPAMKYRPAVYGACPKNETCAFSEGLTHHCTGAGGVGYEKILDWPPRKEPLPTRAWLTNP